MVTLTGTDAEGADLTAVFAEGAGASPDTIDDVEHISSRQNPLVKRLRDLARERGDGDEVLLDGPHLVQEALDAGLELQVAAFAADAALGRLAPLAAACAARGARVVTAPDSVLLMMSPVKQPAGVVAMARLKSSSLQAAIAAGSTATAPAARSRPGSRERRCDHPGR